MTEYVELQRNKGPRASVRLSASASENLHSVSVQHGRLEVRDVDGHWGTVCNKSFSRQSANVVCRQLGLGIAAAITSGTYPIVGHGAPINLAGVNCTGNESSILECPAQHRNAVFCSHVEDVEIKCSGPNTTRECLSLPCPRGFYPTLDGSKNATACDECDSMCIACTGQARNCSECPFGRFLQQIGGTGFTCTSECRHGFYGDALSKQCVQCDKLCSRCAQFQGVTMCIECQPGANRLGTACVANCPSRMHANTLTRTCDPCAPQCGTCSDGRKNDNCTSCTHPMVLSGSSCAQDCSPPLLPWLGVCSAPCANGSYLDGVSGSCKKCPGACVQCTDATHCTLCDFTTLEENGQCVTHCSPGLVAEDVVPYNPFVRLLGSNSSGTGRIEVLYDGRWGTVCDEEWGLPEAMVTCRGLGFSGVRQVRFPYGKAEMLKPVSSGFHIWLSAVNCQGNETSVLNCEHGGWGQHYCRHDEDVAIECGDATVRRCISQCPHGHYGSPLTGCNRCAAYCQTCHSTPSNCTDCYQGYYRLNSKCLGNCPDGYFADSVNNVCTPCSSECAWCSGASTNCTGCGLGKYLQNNTCVSKCGNQFELDFRSSVRLENGSRTVEGDVVLSFRGNWGLMCDFQWDIRDGNVICRQLNYGKAFRVFQKGQFTRRATQPFVVSGARCTGNESRIQDCVTQGSSCRATRIAGVQCTGPDMSRRCVDRCPIGHYGAADGTCRQCDLSCAYCAQDTPAVCTSCHQGFLLEEGRCKLACSSNYHILDGACRLCHPSCLRCSGPNKTDCTHCNQGDYFSNGQCTTSCNGYTAVSPYSAGSTVDIRLAGGTNTSGRVEVLNLLTGQWGTVCDDGWSLASAHVACRLLGLGPAIASINELNRTTDAHTAYFPLVSNVSVPILLGSVDCEGTESTLYECANDSPASYCVHKEDAGVICDLPPSPVCHETCDASQGYRVVDANTSTCEKCSDVCKGCSTDNATVCDACFSGQYLTADGGCVLSCGHGYFANITQASCERCNSKCVGCYDGTRDDNCIRCAKGFVLDGTRCVSTCPSGQLAMHMEVCTAVSAVACDASGTCDEQAGCFNTSSVAGVKSACWPCPAGSVGDGKDCRVYSVEPHTLLTTPRDQTAVIGQIGVELPCHANTSTIINWFHEGHRLSHTLAKFPYRISRSGSLLLDHIQPSMMGTYTCISKTTSLQLSASAYLAVVELVKIEEFNQTTKIAPFSNHTLECKATGYPAPVITWERGLARPIYDDGIHYKLTNNSLTFLRAIDADSDMYYCVANNNHSSAQSATNVIIDETITVKEFNETIEIAVSTNFTLECQATGYPRPTVTWFRASGDNISDDGIQYELAANRLTLLNATFADSDKYYCSGHNNYTHAVASTFISVKGESRLL
ncbi:proprotein convertase subtilisin/kexin type 5-like [Sycon ciliatum]|uniref:proprotein convertase subtilisin/kexin type 5-like n=1 Tax=Sycon ciliatum TaxID=27933 RepID=UPI0031F617D5